MDAGLFEALYEPFNGPVVCFLYRIREKAGGKFVRSPGILYALAPLSLPDARFIGAVAKGHILIYIFTSHRRPPAPSIIHGASMCIWHIDVNYACSIHSEADRSGCFAADYCAAPVITS